MTIQELDVRILHRKGKCNTLSRAPVVGEDKDSNNTMPLRIITATRAGRSTVEEDSFSTKQRNDLKLLEVINVFLETGTLPGDEKQAKVLALTHIEGGVLYHLESDGTVRVIPPTVARRELFEQAQLISMHMFGVQAGRQVNIGGAELCTGIETHPLL